MRCECNRKCVVVSRSAWLLLLIIFSGFPVLAQSPLDNTSFPPGVLLSDNNRTIRIQEVATVRVKPDTLYLLMKMQSESGLLSQAMEDNTKKARAFAEALGRLGIQDSNIRLSNYVVTPLALGSGLSFSRNMIITVAGIDQRPEAETDALVARIQDLGAKYGSHCVTCIGSG